MNQLCYIAIPYSGTAEEKLYRENQFHRAVHELTVTFKRTVVSPMLLLETTHRHDMPDTWQFWQDYCIKLLNHSSEMVVVCVPGWETSTGVRGEIDEAVKLGLTVWLLHMDAPAEQQLVAYAPRAVQTI